MVAAGQHPGKDRASFLASMTDEVEALVLEDNYLQTLGDHPRRGGSARSARAACASDALAGASRAGWTVRSSSCRTTRPSVQRGAAKRGLTRPEIAVLLAYAKNVLIRRTSGLGPARRAGAERPSCWPISPPAMRSLAPEVLNGHRLRREIIVDRRRQ